METRSNFRLVLAVVAILFLGLAFFAFYISGESRSLDARYHVHFTKSVSGLDVGSGVTLSGVPVGRIEAISIDPLNPEIVLITLALNEKVPIRRGVRADISRSLMSGDATLVLIPSSEGPLINPVGRDDIGRIFAVSTRSSGDPAQEAMSVARKLDGVVDSLDAEGQQKISATLEGVVEQTAEWEKTASRLTSSIKPRSIREVADGISGAGRTAERLSRSIESADGDVARARAKIRSFGEGADNFSQSLEEARPSIQQASRQVRQSEKTIRGIRANVAAGKDTIEDILQDGK